MPCGSRRCDSAACRVAAVPLDVEHRAGRRCSADLAAAERPAGAAAAHERSRLDVRLDRRQSCCIALVRADRPVRVRALRCRRRLLGTAGVLPRRPRRTAGSRERNLAAAFPARSEAERRAIVRGAFAHFGRLLFELLKFSTLSPDAMLARVEFEGEERVRHAYAQGKGVLFCHRPLRLLGAAGARARAASSSRWRAGARARQPAAERAARATSARAPATPSSTARARSGACCGCCRRATASAILIDQHIRAATPIYVDFFDRPAATTSARGGAGAAHRRAGGAAVRAAARRRPLPDGLRARRSSRRRPIAPDAVREFTQRCTDVLEMYVRRHPELWLWMHRRWRDDRTRGEPRSVSGASSRRSAKAD